MNYFLKDIVRLLNGTVHGNGNLNAEIQDLLIDSRSLASTEHSLFFALVGERHNGHKFIEDLFQKRVRNFVVSTLPEDLSLFPGCVFILVKDTLASLQHLAATHRKKFKIPVIGITGSNGKTMVKEWLFQLLQEDKNVVRSPKSYNSQVGVPLSVWLTNEQNQIAIFEAGISKPGEMEKLETIVSPTIGIFTNVGQAHDENFLNTKQKIREKLKLFIHAETLIFNRDNLELNDEVVSNPVIKKLNLFTWSKKTKANLQIAKITKQGNETVLQGIYNNEFIDISIPYTDEASIENAIHCWAVLLLLKYSNNVISQRMRHLSPVAMRLELKEGINNCSVINDSYNSDLSSLAIALDFLNQQKQNPKKTLVLSDIFQSGKSEAELYAEVSELIKGKGINRFIGIGEALSRQSNLFSADKSFYKSTEDFLENCKPDFFENEAILLKGARAFGFERIGILLQQKAHETILEINLNRLVHNLNYYRSRLKPETKVMAMVKAFSYGSGGFEIANVLQYHHVDYLAVAYADEGVELRKSGITLSIMVLNPEKHSYDLMIKHNLEPEIFNFRVLEYFEAAVAKSQLFPDHRFPIHIKLDTGMHRLGFEEKDISELISKLTESKFLKVKSVFTHLVGSEDLKHDAFTKEQISSFKSSCTLFEEKLGYAFIKHVLNTAGVIRFPDAQFDMIRLGIGLYGIGSNAEEITQIKNVSSLKTAISQIKNISKGSSIGYDRKFVAPKDMRIATVSIGYADGLSRVLSNGKGKMIIHGKRAPIVGNVCMDMCMLDITDTPCAEGDEVIVFGNGYTAYEMAKDMGTIPYELFTSISRRVKRVYFHE